MKRSLPIALVFAVMALASCVGDLDPRIDFEQVYDYGEGGLDTPRAARRMAVEFNRERDAQTWLEAGRTEGAAVVEFDDLEATVGVTFWHGGNSPIKPHRARHKANEGSLTVYLNGDDGPFANLTLRDFDEDARLRPGDNEDDVLTRIEARGVPTNLFREIYDEELIVGQVEWNDAARFYIYERENEQRDICGRLFDCHDQTFPEILLKVNDGTWREAEGIGTVYVGEERGFGAGRFRIDDIGNPDSVTEDIDSPIYHPHGYGIGSDFDIEFTRRLPEN